MTLICFGPNISKTTGDRESVKMERVEEMLYGASNGHLTKDITRPQKVKVATPIYLEPNISKTLGDRDLFLMEHQ